ncbi:MAG: DUF362 domain-containing protein [Candidatus Altiarchaeota archaeon]
MPAYVSKTNSYQEDDLVMELEKALDELGFVFTGKKTAFLKPNIVVPAKPDSVAITNPAVAKAVIEVLRKNGIEDITIGEGVGVGQNAKLAFQESGYKKLAEELGVKLVDLDSEERTKVDWKFGKLKLPKIALESDLYVNLAKMKTHGQSQVTLALKNQKGLLLPQDKKNFHVKWGLHEPIAELAKIIAPDISIVDGIEAMEGEGPINGKKKKAGVLVIGDNLVEVDSVSSQIMEISPYEVDHIKGAAELGLGSLQPKVLGTPVDAAKTTFIPANQEFGHVLGIYSFRNPYACSMCIQNFSAAMKMAVTNPRYWLKVPKLGYYAVLGRLNLVQGKKTCIPNVKGRMLCMGQCTKELAEKKGFTHVPGCPPKPEDIIKAI